jgi:hypothetical protein
MADVTVGAGSDKLRGFLKPEHGCITALGILLACLPEQPNRVNDQEERNHQQRPGDQLVPGKWLLEPDIDIEQRQGENGFPGKKKR